MPSKKKAEMVTTYRVANPRGISSGHYIIRAAGRLWFEGDLYDGPVTERFVRDAFLVPAEEVTDGEE